MTPPSDANSAEPAEVCAPVSHDIALSRVTSMRPDGSVYHHSPYWHKGEVFGRYGSLYPEGNSVIIWADGQQLYDWARRPGCTWPCSELQNLEELTAWIDRDNGDLVDLSLSSADDNVSGAELTAWIDDNLAGTPFAHLARNPEATS